MISYFKNMLNEVTGNRQLDNYNMNRVNRLHVPVMDSEFLWKLYYDIYTYGSLKSPTEACSFIMGPRYWKETFI